MLKHSFNETFNENLTKAFTETKDTIIFDGNSLQAHLIIRDILVKNQTQLFDLIPKQNIDYFGLASYFGLSSDVDLSICKICVLTRDGALLDGLDCLAHISQRMKESAKSRYH